MKTRLPLVIAAVVAAFIFGWLVWPTPYVYSTGQGEIFRVNRYTGVKQWPTDNGWRTEAELTAESRRFYAAEIEKKVDRLRRDAEAHRIEGAWKMSSGLGVSVMTKDGVEQFPATSQDELDRYLDALGRGGVTVH